MSFDSPAETDVVRRFRYIYIYITPVAEWIECALAVREVSGSSPVRGGHINPCERSFRWAVKIQWFLTPNIHDTNPRTT